MKKQVYQVINIEQRPSKLNGGFYYNIKLQDIKTLEILETSVDPVYKNFQNWVKVIQDQNLGQLLSNCTTTERKGKRIINADSKPTQEIVCDRDELLTQLESWRAPTKFSELFNYE
jgi:hypothetical protein